MSLPSRSILSRTDLGFAARLVVLSVLSACGRISAQEATPTPASVPATASASPTSRSVPVISPTTTVDVTVWLAGTAADIASFSRVVDTYSETHPGIAFHLVHMDWTEMRVALQSASSPERPSILIAPSTWGPDLLNAREIVALSSISPATVPEGITPLAWQAVTYRGRVLGAPISLAGNVWYRNRSVAPGVSDTAEEWVRQASRLRPSFASGGVLDLGYLTIAPWFWACDGSVWATEDRLVVDLEAGECWARILDTVAAAGNFTQSTDEDREAFLRGQGGWLIDESTAAAEIQSALGKDSLQVDPWPLYGPTGRTLPGFVWAEAGYLAGNGSAQELEAARAFLIFLLSPEAQAILFSGSEAHWLTVRLDLELNDAWKAQLLGALRTGVLRPVVAGIPPEVEILERAARAVALQGTNPVLAWQDTRLSLSLLPAAPTP